MHEELSNAVFSMEPCRIQSQGRVQTCHVSNQYMLPFNTVPLLFCFADDSVLLSLCCQWPCSPECLCPAHCYCLTSWYMDMHSVCCGFYCLKTPSYGFCLLGPLAQLWSIMDSFFYVFSKINSLVYFILQLFNPSHLLLNVTQTLFHEEIHVFQESF